MTSVASSSSTPLGRGEISSSLGWVPPPEQLDLLQVIYVLRHGERTPVRRRLTSAEPPLPHRWNLCHASQVFGQSVMQHTGSDVGLPYGKPHVPRRIEFTVRNDAPQAGEHGDCLLGELTDKGRKTMQHIGEALRARYVDAEHLLPPNLANEDARSLYLRSTHMSRTIQSLEELVRGLVGPNAVSTPEILVRNTFDEDLLPNPRKCPKLGVLMQKFADLAVDVYNPRLAKYDDVVAPLDGGAAPRLNDGPRLSGLFDTMRSATAHGIQLPQSLENPELQTLMEHAVLDEWFGGYASRDPDERRQYRRMALGTFFEGLCDTFTRRATLGDADPRRMSILLGHDATLVGMTHMLDVCNHRWPAFGAGLGLELFRDRSSTEPVTAQHMPGYYVRCRYGDEELRLPGCQAPGKHWSGRPELCTLDAFREIVVDRLRHPQGLTIQQECTM